MHTQDIQLPGHISYLVVEGVIGAGKTSFANILAERFNGRIILEEAEQNPFLHKFYSDRRTFAFQTQLWFLVSRYKQLSVMVAQQDLFHELTVSDYLFAKDRIFANINLEDDELGLYNNIARVMECSIPKPELVIYLQASTETLLKRIHKRGRSYEATMDPDYIDLLNQSYNHFFFHYTASPLLIINTNEIDFVNDQGDLEELVAQLSQIKSGTNYYRPLGARNRAAIEERRTARDL